MWSKIADEFPSHPKILEVGPLGAWLQVSAICYCNKFLTDGRLTKAQAESLVRALGTGAFDCDWPSTMVRCGLWDKTEDGYSVHDFLQYNPSREQAVANQETRSAAGKAGADSRWHSKPHGKRHNTSHGKCHGKTMAKVCSESDPDPVSDPKPETGTDPHPHPLSGATPDDAHIIVADLNFQAGRNYKAVGKTVELIHARMAEGFTVDDFREVHRRKCATWKNDPEYAKFLRPETLYCKLHFDSYRNEPTPDDLAAAKQVADKEALDKHLAWLEARR